MTNLEHLQRGLDELEEKIKARIRERTGKPEPTLREELEQQWLRIAERNNGIKIWRSFPTTREMKVSSGLASLDNFVVSWKVYTGASDDEINMLESNCFCILDYIRIDEQIKSGVPVCDII